MRTTRIVLVLLMLAGCQDFEEAMNTEREGGPVAPGGIATANDIDDVQQAASGQAPAQAKQPEQQAADQPPEQPDEPKQPEQKAPTSKSILGKTTANVVDAKKALQNPKMVLAGGKIEGSDPLTVAGSAYQSMAAKTGTVGMQQAVQQHKALNGKFPTYQEFMQIVKQNRVEFPELAPYRLYGYHEETGKIVVLEDKAKKIQLFKKNGIPLEPGDEKYQ